MLSSVGVVFGISMCVLAFHPSPEHKPLRATVTGLQVGLLTRWAGLREGNGSKVVFKNSLTKSGRSVRRVRLIFHPIIQFLPFFFKKVN